MSRKKFKYLEFVCWCSVFQPKRNKIKNLLKKSKTLRIDCFGGSIVAPSSNFFNVHTVFPRIVSAETILF